MPPEPTIRTLPLERGDKLSVRMPGDAERAQYQLRYDQPVIVIWRASGGKEVHPAETAVIEVGPKEVGQ